MFRGSRTVFEPLRRGSLCSGHHRIISSNQVCLRLRPFSLWFEGTTCLFFVFCFDGHISSYLLTFLVLMCSMESVQWWHKCNRCWYKKEYDQQHILVSYYFYILLHCPQSRWNKFGNSQIRLYVWIFFKQIGNSKRDYHSANSTTIVLKWTPKVRLEVPPSAGWARGPQLAALRLRYHNVVGPSISLAGKKTLLRSLRRQSTRHCGWIEAIYWGERQDCVM